MERISDPGRWGGISEEDPASVAKFIRRMGEDMGEDVSREEIEQMADDAAREMETGGLDSDVSADTCLTSSE
jgi:hypothetical protein